MPDYTPCRTLGHSWDFIPVPLAERPRDGVFLWLRCVRCTMTRKDEVDPSTGGLFRRHYEQPPEYGRSRDDYRPRDDWRRDYLRMVGILRRDGRPKRSASSAPRSTEQKAS